MTLAQRVKDCRYAKGWGPDELASRAAISRTALYQIESGKTEHPREQRPGTCDLPPARHVGLQGPAIIERAHRDHARLHLEREPFAA